MTFVKRLKDYLNKGEERSIKAKKNIIQMLFVKGCNILLGMAIVPLTLDYVDSETYGIWLALSSMVAWISFFDIGLNNGLKNNLAKALATKDYELGKKYVSTTYAMLVSIFIPLMILLLIIAPILDWERILNLPSEQTNGLLASICVIITYFCINFILNTVNVVLTADQRPGDAAVRTLVQQLLSFLIIFVLTKTTNGNLLYLCMALCFSPLCVVSLFNITLFNTRYKMIAPSYSSIDLKLIPHLMKLGVQFFIIQVAGIIQYQMTNFLILRYFGASEVAAYNIGYKYFSVLTMVWNILTTPLWVAFTDAILKKDFIWIKNVIHKYTKLLLLFMFLGVIMLSVSNIAYDLWIGNKVVITFSLSLWIMLYNFVTMFSNIYVFFINGSGQLKIQTVACTVSPIVFLLVCFGLMRLDIGIISIIIASIVANFNGIILAPLQTRYLIKKFENGK